MKTLPLAALAGAAAALICAAPAFADDSVAPAGGPAAAPATPVVDPNAAGVLSMPLAGIPADHDVYAAQLPNGEQYLIHQAPTQLTPDGEDPDEVVLFLDY